MKAISVASSLLVLATAVILPDQPASACRRGEPHYKVFSDFVTQVKSQDGRPLEAIEVRIIRFVTKSEGSVKKVVPENVASVMTDKDGIAAFHSLEPGEYFIASQHAKVAGGTARLRVDAAGDAKLTLQWPAVPVPIIRLQHLAGNLAVGKEHTALANAEIALVEAYSAQDIGKTMTDSQGRFAFEDLKPGLYVMHIEEQSDSHHQMWKIEGRMVLELSPNAANTELPRYGLIFTDCGLGAYKEDGSRILFE